MSEQTTTLPGASPCAGTPNPAPVIDAYCHVGMPRFGSAEDAWAVLGHAGSPVHAPVERVVFVLGPRMPDYATLFGALQRYGEEVRGIGIPYGDTGAQVLESVLLQLTAGVLGLRVEPEPLLAQPDILTLLGEWGRWCYAIGAVSSPEVAQALLAWLERYPEARVAAPHFLKPDLLLVGDDRREGVVRELLSHPRFFPIFSRHGAMGSRLAYPHEDLLPWVEQVITLVGWERLLWGSEYPVFYWRDETLASCQRWLSTLLEGLQPEPQAAYLGGNAARVIFSAPAPPRERVAIPDWIGSLFEEELARPDRPVPLFPDGLDLPMTVYASLHHRYVAALRDDPLLTFSRFVTRQLADESASEERRGSGIDRGHYG
jgi:hypothetical protein